MTRRAPNDNFRGPELTDELAARIQGAEIVGYTDAAKALSLRLPGAGAVIFGSLLDDDAAGRHPFLSGLLLPSDGREIVDRLRRGAAAAMRNRLA